MDEGQRTQVSIKEKVSESGKRAPILPPKKKETTWVERPQQLMQIREKTHRWGTGVGP